MCEKGDLTFMPELGKYGIYVDSCMVDKIREVLALGTETVACCCGHGKYPETIVIRYEDGSIIELNTPKRIPRKRNFYRMDDEGYYFIPETVDNIQYKKVI